jgi:hypothetical protein
MAKSGTTKDKSWGTLGGNQHMHSWSGSGKQEPGQAAQEGSGGRRDMGPHAGGQVGFYASGTQNKFGAGPQDPGQSSASGARQEGFAHGGKTSMHGNRGSQRAEPGCSSPH